MITVRPQTQPVTIDWLIFLFLILIILQFVVDFITGTKAAKQKRNLSSKKAKDGFTFFLETLLAFMVAESIGIVGDGTILRILGHNTSVTVQVVLCGLLTAYYSYIQVLSICENLLALDYPIPTSLANYIKHNNDRERADDALEIAKILIKLNVDKDKIKEILEETKNKSDK